MNKSELAEAIAQEVDISKSATQKVSDATTNAVASVLKNGDTVILVGFDTSYVGEHVEHQGHSPKTDEFLAAVAVKTPKFRTDRALKDVL